MNAAVIVAAGRGSRMGLDRNKVLYPVCGEPVIVRTVRAFERSGLFDGGIVVVTGACDMDEMRGMLDHAGLSVRAVVEGGADRQESVCRGIAACAETGESDNTIIENFPYIRINKHNDNETFHYIRHSMPEFSYGVMYWHIRKFLHRWGK